MWTIAGGILLALALLVGGFLLIVLVCAAFVGAAREMRGRDGYGPPVRPDLSFWVMLAVLAIFASLGLLLG